MNSRSLRLTHATQTRNFRRQALAAACSAALLGLAFCGTAIAQDTQPATTTGSQTTKTKTPAAKKNTEKKPADQQNAQNLNAVVVTGIAGSIANALETKRNSNEIVEAISAEDIGKLPDASIAESLSRVPGLATQRLNGRANMISIRGLSPDFAGTTLDGREQATTGENRGVEYDQYPSELISGVTIYKTPDATLIGQGLSGTVDLHTIRPLDMPTRAISMNVRGEYTTNGNLSPGTGINAFGHRASISYIDQYFDHTLGLAVGFAQLDSPIQTRGYRNWWWGIDNGDAGMEQNWGTNHTVGLPDNVISQQGAQVSAKTQQQIRNGLMAVLEWAPNDSYHSTLNAYYSTFNDKTYNNQMQWSNSPFDNYSAGGADPNAIPSYSNVGITQSAPYPLVTSGTINGVKLIPQNGYTGEHDKLFSTGWKNEYDFGNGWTAMADLSYSSARVRLHDAYVFTGLANNGITDVAFNLPTWFGYPNLVTSTNLNYPGNWVFSDPNNNSYDGREEFDRQKDTIKAARFEVSHTLGWIFSDVVLGFDYSERTKTKAADVYFAYLNGNGNGLTTGPYNNLFSAPIGFLRGSTKMAYAGLGNILYYNVLDALSSNYYLTERNGNGDWSRNYSITERVPVTYVKFNIDTMLGDIPLRGNVGVQAVHTNQSSQALQTNGDTLVGRISDGTTYNNVLPSLNLVAQITDRQDLRFGFAKTMARGRIDDEKVSTSASADLVTSGPETGKVLWSGSGGNPHLKPYVAVGTDLSYEFYFGKSSYFAAAVFNKNLLNYIYNKTTLDYDFSHYTNDNPNVTPTSNIGTFTMPMNGTGGKMQGLELSGSLEGGLIADALEGFGVQGNFSLTNSTIPQSSVSSIPGAPSTLPGLSRKVANLALFYERYGWSVRIAQRYRSSFAGEAVADFDQLAYTMIQPNRETDFQLGYEFNDGQWKGLSLLLQVSNLGNSPDAQVIVSGMPNGVQVSRPIEYDTYGRTVLFGVTYKL